MQQLLISGHKSVTAYIWHIMDHAENDPLIVVVFVVILISFTNSHEQMQNI